MTSMLTEGAWCCGGAMMKNRAFGPLLVILTLSGWTGCSVDAEGNQVIGGPGFGNASIYDLPSVIPVHKTVSSLERAVRNTFSLFD